MAHGGLGIGRSSLSTEATEVDLEGVAEACFITLNSKGEFLCLRRMRGGSDAGATEMPGDERVDAGRDEEVIIWLSPPSVAGRVDLFQLAGCENMVVVVGRGAKGKQLRHLIPYK